MSYKIDIFCPDEHIRYNLHTLEEEGVVYAVAGICTGAFL
jgi:hypothetical protein